jgi:hypothetical protein
MGGQAFNVGSQIIRVPRMTPGMYQMIAEATRTKLETLFNHVTIPREAPGKLDHGDIDFLVEGIRSFNGLNVWDTIKSLLGAELHASRGGSHSFGVSHPDIHDAYIQIDVELSPGNGTPDSTELFEWTRWMKGDSDILQIIGVCHRPLGLLCNDRGLHVRIEEIEPYDKKKALLFLTRDPNKAMELYGLDTSKYWEGFQDEADLFAWVSRGRFFAWEIFEGRTEKSNDRTRQNKRPMYRRFVEEYMPAHPGLGGDKQWSRKEVLNEALDMFGKREQYQRMLAEHDARETEEALWTQIRQLLPESNTLGVALKGLRRWVDFTDGKPYITAQPLDNSLMWTAVVPTESTTDVLNWVAENWQEVKLLEKRRAKEAREMGKSNMDA